MKNDGKKLDAQSVRYYKLLIESDLIYKVLRPALFAGYMAKSPFIFINTKNGFKLENDDPKLASFEINLNDFDEKLNFKNEDPQKMYSLIDMGFDFDTDIPPYDSTLQNSHVTESEDSLKINVQRDQYLNSGEYDPDNEAKIFKSTKYMDIEKGQQNAMERMSIIAQSNPDVYHLHKKISGMLSEIAKVYKEDGNREQGLENIEKQYSSEITAVAKFLEENHFYDEKDKYDPAIKQYVAYLAFFN